MSAIVDTEYQRRCSVWALRRCAEYLLNSWREQRSVLASTATVLSGVKDPARYAKRQPGLSTAGIEDSEMSYHFVGYARLQDDCYRQPDLIYFMDGHLHLYQPTLAGGAPDIRGCKENVVELPAR